MRTSPRLVASYSDFAADLVAEGILSDPWIDGAPRFRMTPVALDRATQAALYGAAEGVAAVHAEAAELCACDPALVARFFDLPPSYEMMWRSSAPHWHGIARADVFLTASGPQVCELNSDTPSGEPEAVALNRLVDGAKAEQAKAENQALTPLAVMMRGYEALEALGGTDTHILLGDWSHVPSFLFPGLPALSASAAKAKSDGKM
jgi:hypothetical protein